MSTSHNPLRFGCRLSRLPIAIVVDRNVTDSSLPTSVLANVALWVAPIALLFAAYHNFFSVWWMADDSMLLLSVVRHGVVAHFVRPLIDLELAPSNLTPWLYASYGIDFAIGGLNPRIAYVHHLISWVATLAVLTILLRRWLGPKLTAAVLVWFVSSVPTLAVILFLCTRHYVEGLLFSLLCVLAYIRHLRNGRTLYLVLSAGCYALAMAAKEVFVPLGPLLVVHYALFPKVTTPHSEFNSAAAAAIARLRCACMSLWPHVTLAAAYVLYRGYMLGFSRLLSGYDAPKWRTRPAMLLEFPATWEWACHWKRWQSIAWLALVILGLALWLARSSRAQRWQGIVFGLAITLAILAPIYPVLGMLTVYHSNPHYLFIPLLAFFVLAGWASRECMATLSARFAAGTSAKSVAIRRNINIAMASILVLLCITQLATARRHGWPWTLEDRIAQYRTEGEYELYSDDQSLIIDAQGPSWHHFGLQNLRKLVLNRGPGPVACVADDCGTAIARQQAVAGICVRFFSGPPRLERVACTMKLR